MAIKIKFAIIIFLCTTSLLGCKVSEKSRDKKFKLLVYVTLNDSLQMNETGCNWNNNNYCLRVKVDTIEKSLILKSSINNQMITYKGNSFYKSQIFELSDCNYLSNLIVSSFSVSNSKRLELEIFGQNSNCLNSDQKEKIYNARQTIKLREGENEKFKLFFENITISSVNNKDFVLINRSFIGPIMQFDLTK